MSIFFFLSGSDETNLNFATSYTNSQQISLLLRCQVYKMEA